MIPAFFYAPSHSAAGFSYDQFILKLDRVACFPIDSRKNCPAALQGSLFLLFLCRLFQQGCPELPFLDCKGCPVNFRIRCFGMQDFVVAVMVRIG